MAEYRCLLTKAEFGKALGGFMFKTLYPKNLAVKVRVPGKIHAKVRRKISYYHLFHFCKFSHTFFKSFFNKCLDDRIYILVLLPNNNIDYSRI